jgi:hypothetical protein
VNHIELNGQDEAIKQFFLSLPAEADGSLVELNGRALARVLPVAKGRNGAAADAGPWTEAKNNRRCQLVDREIGGILSPEEAAELAVLQEQFFKERRRLAPVGLDDLRRLHQDLLAKAQQEAGQDGA